MTIPQYIRDGASSALTYCLAIASAALLVSSQQDLPPILPALLASLLLAGVEWGFQRPSPHAIVEPTRGNLASWLVDFLLASIVLLVLARIMPRGAQFACEPLVPWGISIAIFGAFFSAWIAAAMNVRASDRRYQPLVRLMLFWIAPFYGFFHAPWFLAQSLAVPCPNRSLVQVVIAALALLISAAIGARVGAWMFSRSA